MESPSTATSTIIPTTTQVQSSTGKSKHLILILLIIFPPLAWYYMWKEEKYHNWFASVLMIDGLIFLGTSILLLHSVYPPLIKLYDSLNIPNSQLYKLIPYTFITIGIIEILFSIYLKFQIKKNGSLSKRILILTILLLTIHFIGLPLGQIASYLSVATSLYDINNKYYSAIPTPQPRTVPSPTIDPTANWKTYENNKYGFTFQYPGNLKINEKTETSSIDFKSAVPTFTFTDKQLSIKITLENNPQNLSVRRWIDNLIKQEAENCEIDCPGYSNPTKTVIVNGKEVLMQNLGSVISSLNAYVQIDDSHILTMRGINMSESEISQTTTDAFIKILSTFKFFDETSPTPIITNSPNDQVMCTMDAKICPDGSSVGRTGPNCEFSTCP